MATSYTSSTLPTRSGGRRDASIRMATVTSLALFPARGGKGEDLWGGKGVSPATFESGVQGTQRHTLHTHALKCVRLWPNSPILEHVCGLAWLCENHRVPLRSPKIDMLDRVNRSRKIGVKMLNSWWRNLMVSCHLGWFLMVGRGLWAVGEDPGLWRLLGGLRRKALGSPTDAPSLSLPSAGSSDGSGRG